MPKSDINVTPLIDVLLVLLIIFIVVAPAAPRAIDALLPAKAEPSGGARVRAWCSRFSTLRKARAPAGSGSSQRKQTTRPSSEPITSRDEAIAGEAVSGAPSSCCCTTDPVARSST
jgi:Biopolymer transport protein ExbD/TolR